MELGHAGADDVMPGREAERVGVRTWPLTDILFNKQVISTKLKSLVCSIDQQAITSLYQYQHQEKPN